ncbi:hypothetical protein QBC47DRAFT_465327, partial [Echria macrotheca]
MPPNRSDPIDRFFRTPQYVRDPVNLFHISILVLHWDMAFSGHFDLARTILELFLPYLPSTYKGPPNIRALATVWFHVPAARPSNGAPESWPEVKIITADESPSMDIFTPEFYTKWEEKYWIPSQGYIKPDKYDPHAWRTSKDHYECATCARILCRVPPGQVPSRKALEEAFEAMDRIWGLGWRDTWR